MIRISVFLFFHFLSFIISPAFSAAQNITPANIHIKAGDEQTCNICHVFNEVLREGTSNICIECHKDTITIRGDNTLATHVLPMNRHVIKSPLPPGEYYYEIIEEEGRIYVEYRKNRLPLFGANSEKANMECATCHDPHNESGIPRMLRVDNSRGQLCEVCHNLTQLKLDSFDFTAYSKHARFEDVHIWPGSKCNICHVSSSPDEKSSSLVNIDQSRLCESCHKGTVTIQSGSIMKSDNDTMSNHPIKFSPLYFDPDKINHNILKEGTYFYVIGKKGKVPLFGKARESSVAECGTCHDPHGKSRLPKLHRIKNTGGEICLTCHIGIKS